MPTVFTASTPVLKEFEKTVCAYKLRSCGVILSCICPLMYMNNPDIYKKPMPGKALCLPMTIGSTTGGMVLCTACSMGKQPACMLFSQPIDSPAASGAILGDVWTGAKMPVVDKPGDEFLETVKTGMRVVVKEDGVVEVE